VIKSIGLCVLIFLAAVHIVFAESSSASIIHLRQSALRENHLDVNRPTQPQAFAQPELPESNTPIETGGASKKISPEERGQVADLSFAPKRTALTSTDPKKLSALDRAYLDAFTILRENNGCSQLYGGPSAIEALNELVVRLRPTYLDHNVAIRMSGETTLFKNNRNGFSFRMFEKAEINRGGPFYRANGPTERRIPLVGRFQPNTREARLVVLLHELGHLVGSADDHWVLSDDGNDTGLSVKNSEFVVRTCRKEIDLIGRMTAKAQLEQKSTEVTQLSKVP
jgi:hypothetical protein